MINQNNHDELIDTLQTSDNTDKNDEGQLDYDELESVTVDKGKLEALE